MTPHVTTANAWRWEYPRVPNAYVTTPETAEMLHPLNHATSQRDLKRQKRLKRTTGFPGHASELAHIVEYELLRRGHSKLEALLAAHLVSTGGDWNFQGNVRIAMWIDVSIRSVRRARAVLERAGWIRSYVLLAGEKVPGQRAPVTRPRVVREVSKLQRLARSVSARLRTSEPRKGREPRKGNVRGGVAAKSPSPDTAAPPRTPSAAELASEVVELESLASRAPEWLRGSLAVIAAAKRESMTPAKRPEIPDGPTPAEIDEIERELLEQSEPPPSTEPSPKPPPPRR